LLVTQLKWKKKDLYRFLIQKRYSWVIKLNNNLIILIILGPPHLGMGGPIMKPQLGGPPQQQGKNQR
jgi:hypothetical protein